MGSCNPVERRNPVLGGILFNGSQEDSCTKVTRMNLLPQEESRQKYPGGIPCHIMVRRIVQQDAKGIPTTGSRRNPLPHHGQEDCTTGGRRNPENPESQKPGEVLYLRCQEESCSAGGREESRTSGGRRNPVPHEAGGIPNYGMKEESCTT